jgi:VWFA-related protein
MTRLMLSLLVTICCGLAGPRAQDPDQSQARRLSLDIVAVDRKGEPVRDLKASELEVWIGHYRAPIRTLTVVEPVPGVREPARLIVLLLDDVTIPPAIVPRARDIARAFVSRLRADDRVLLLSLSGAWSETSGDPARLRRALDDYSVRASGFDRPDVLSEHLLGTIASVARQLTESPGARKTLVAIGSGVIFDRPIPPPGTGRDVQHDWVEAMRALAFAHMHLYVIDPSGVGSTPADGGRNGFAHASGGHAFLNTNDIGAVVDRILRDASNYYVVDLPDPPVGRNSDLRDVEIKVLRPGITVLARRAIPGRAE